MLVLIYNAACFIAGGFLLALLYWHSLQWSVAKFSQTPIDWQQQLIRGLLTIVRIVIMVGILAYGLHQKTVGGILMIGSLTATLGMLVYRRIRT